MPRKRQKQVSVYLDDDISAFITTQAYALSLSESSYVRNLILIAREQYRNACIHNANIQDQPRKERARPEVTG